MDTKQPHMFSYADNPSVASVIWVIFLDGFSGFTVGSPWDSNEEEEACHGGWAGAEAAEEGGGCSQESQNAGGDEEEAGRAEIQEKVKIY